MDRSIKGLVARPPRRTNSFCLAFLTCFLLLAATACSQESGTPPTKAPVEAPVAKAEEKQPDAVQPAILLVTLDTTRADHIGAYGYSAARTPTIDDLARRGVLFERAWAPTPITLPSHASLLTGVYPGAHGVRDNGTFRVAPEALLLSEVLLEQGFRTAAFVGSFVLDAGFGLAQGFEEYGGPSNREAGLRAEVIDLKRGTDALEERARVQLGMIKEGEVFFQIVESGQEATRVQPISK